MANIILIGMPSSGKSTVGVLLAKNLGYRFLDSDLLIQEKTGKLLHELISERGTDGFLKIEEELLSAIDTNETVIATGGSAIYGARAMEHLQKSGTVVYLKIDYQTLALRLGDYTHRGVVMPEGYSLADLYRERSALYERYADITVEESLQTGLGDTVERVTSVCRSILQKGEV